MVILFSLFLSALFAVMASEIFGGANLFGMKIVGNAESNMLIGVFILTFLISAISITITIMRGQNLEASRRPGFLAPQAKEADPKGGDQETPIHEPQGRIERRRRPQRASHAAAGPSAQS